jgi:hypothetical protein
MAPEAFTASHLGHGVSRVPLQIGDTPSPKPHRAMEGEGMAGGLGGSTS